jgi:hypothetical protein
VGEICGRPERLERLACAFELFPGQIGPTLLPLAAPERQPVVRDVGLRSTLLERCDPLGEQLLRRRRLSVQPPQPAHPAKQRNAPVLVGYVRERVLDELDRLTERNRPLGIVGTAQANRDGVGKSPGAEQMARDLDRTRTCFHECVRSARVDSLPAREDGVGRDRLLRQRVAPAVPAVIALDDQLMRHCGGERGLHGVVVRLRHGSERRVVERASEDRRGAKHLHLQRVESCEAQEDRVAHGLRDSQLLERATFPADVGLEDVAVLHGLPEHLLDYEGIPFRPVVQQVAKLAADIGALQDRGDHLGNLCRAEGR